MKLKGWRLLVWTTASFSLIFGAMGEVWGNWSSAMAFAALVAVACTPGEIIAGRERHSMGSRFRGMLFWAVFLFTVASANWLVSIGIRWMGFKPLLTIDIGGAGETLGPVLRVVLASVLAFVPAFILDFTYYWFHRMQHAIPFLWRLHAVHHSIEEMNAANCSHHWTEGFLRAMLIIAPLMVLIDLRLPEIAVVSTIIGTWGQFVHADSRLDFGPLRWLVVSPVFHRVHHSIAVRHFDKNFAGQFAFIDVLFGTAVFLAKGEIVKTGLADKHEPKTLAEYVIRLRPKR